MAQSNPDQIATYLSRLASARDLRLLLQPAGLEAAENAEATENRRLAAEGVDRILQSGLPSPEQTAALEAIVLPKIRPVLDVIDCDFRTDHPLWLKLNTDNAIRGALRAALPSIGRIELPGNADYPYGGTGFVVGEGLVMTNRHVAAIFASGLGTQVRFRPGYRAGIDFLRELDRPTGPAFKVVRIVMLHPYWDMALLAVEGLPESAKPLRLASRGVDGAAVEVAAVGYPAFDTRNDADVQNDLFRREFGVKRLQPGTLDGVGDTESFGKTVSALRHNCSTLGGNSGSALVDFANGYVVALHFGGRYRQINYAVPISELAKDQRIVDAGVLFEPPSVAVKPPSWAIWWAKADERTADDSTPSPGSRPASAPAVVTPANGTAMPDGSVAFVVPLTVTFRLGTTTQYPTVVDVGAEPHSDDSVEKLVMPWHDDDYSSRTGYDASFLGVKIPMPKPADPSVVARAKDGAQVLHYQNFSIVMHAKRRLALLTASNVTAELNLKKPEANRKYTRKALSGLGENDQERWFPDPRLDDSFQLPDVFYTRDDGAFDKGHVVRREDVAWGDTYESLRRANGDTYHVTNCSPQVAGFNRSTLGQDNWGDLEDQVLKGAALERYCQFAGPVLEPNDDVFVGNAGNGRKLRVKIPSRFWKVIVARTTEGLASYGFVLEQDLSDLPLEFVVPDRFVKYMEPLAELQQRIGIRFPDVVVDADQHGTAEGIEFAMRTGIKRRSAALGASREGLPA